MDDAQDNGSGSPVEDTQFTVGGSENQAGAVFIIDADATNDYLVATVGRTLFDGGAGDDILEDHNAELTTIGGPGNDRMISRNGRDVMWGGNVFGLTNCVDTDNGETDFISATCADYISNQQICGPFDDDDFVAGDLCCICGGGTEDDTVVVDWFNSGDNAATTFNAMTGEIENLGDRDTYVIYPT